MDNKGEIFSEGLMLVERFPAPSPRTVAEGEKSARSYILSLIKREKIDRKKKTFGPGILTDLHKRIVFYYPGWAGQFRVSTDTRIAGRTVPPPKELPDLVYRFERWLENEVDKLKQNPEDLDGALKAAAAAHHGIVDIHPFEDGSGRVARMIANGILMINTSEGIHDNLYVFPVPRMRDPIDEKETRRLIENGKEPKLTPYIKAVKEVRKTSTLNPFEVFLAVRWADSIFEYLNLVESKFKSSHKENWLNNLDEHERRIVEKMKERWRRLMVFIEEDRTGKKSLDKIPNYSIFWD